MTITVGTDTYVTVVEADAYFAARFGFPDWAALAAEDKEKALVSAAQILDTQCEWYGYKSVDTQALAFPRTPDADPTPQPVKDSQCEIAYAINSTGSTSTSGEQKLQSLEADGNIEWYEGKDYTNPLVSPLVATLLAEYGVCTCSGSTTMIDIGRA